MSKTKTDEHSKKALKAGVWYTASSFLRKGIGFISGPIFVTLLTKKEYGIQSNFAAWFSMAAVLCTLNLKSSVSRAKFDYEDDFDQYLSSITFFGTASTAFFYFIVMLFQDFFVNLFGFDMIYIHVMFLELLIAPSLDILQAKHRIQQKYKVQVAISIFISLSSTFVSLFMAYSCRNRLFGKIMGAEITNMVIYAVVFLYVMYKGRKLIDFNAWKYAAAYSVPMIPHLLSNNVLGSGDKMMITKICGSEANGMYSLAYQGGMIVATLMTCFNQAMVPWLFEKLHAKDYGIIRKVNRYYMAGFSVIVLGSVLLAPEVRWILSLGKKDYAGTEMLVAPVMLGYGFKFAYTNYVNVEQYEKKTALVTMGTFVAAGFNLITNAIFIPMFGYMAAAYTTCASFVVLLLMHYLICRKSGLTVMYDNKFNFIILAVMSTISFFIPFLYPYMIVRIVIAFIIGTITLAGMYKIKKAYF